MKLFALTALAAILMVVAPAEARSYTHLSLGFGYYGCCGYTPYYSPYYYGYPPYYYAPAPTVIYQEPVVPPVTYVVPSQTTVMTTAPAVTPSAVAASQASEPYVDTKGRTCRKFQSTINGAPVSGIACLQPDGTWRTVGE